VFKKNAPKMGIEFGVQFIATLKIVHWGIHWGLTRNRALSSIKMSSQRMAEVLTLINNLCDTA
jgi:hypothetical protein